MKAKLEFDLDSVEDRHELERALRAPRLIDALNQITDELRRIDKNCAIPDSGQQMFDLARKIISDAISAQNIEDLLY